MLIRTPIRIATLLVVSSLAGFSPISLSAQSPQMAADTSPVSPAQQPPKLAAVSYNNAGKIAITAENASLNQILRDISRQTGMKITGGVNDERVFGDYGPATPGIVLSQLLNGTGSNMLLVQTPGAVPTELILTPRNGGPTPPDPNAATRSRSDDTNSNNNYRGPIGNRIPLVRPPNRPPNNPLQPNRPPPPAANNVPAQPGASTTQESPNGVKTPQEIFNQIQEMRRQELEQNNPQ